MQFCSARRCIFPPALTAPRPPAPLSRAALCGNPPAASPAMTRTTAPARRISITGAERGLPIRSAFGSPDAASATAGDASVTIGTKLAAAGGQAASMGSAKGPSRASSRASPRVAAGKPASGAPHPSPSRPPAASRRRSVPSRRPSSGRPSTDRRGAGPHRIGPDHLKPTVAAIRSSGWPSAGNAARGTLKILEARLIGHADPRPSHAKTITKCSAPPVPGGVQLQAAINRHITEHNSGPNPFISTALGHHLAKPSG